MKPDMHGEPPVSDADAHVIEPDTIWEDYIDPRFRDRAPSARAGGEACAFGGLRVSGEVITDRISAELEVRSALHLAKHYAEPMRAGWSPASHVASLRRIGFERAFLYPTVGLWMLAVDSMEVDLAGALARAYNDWLFEFCRYDPVFLNGVGVVSRHDPEGMVAELRRVAGFGWRAVCVRPNPIRGRILSHPDYEPFWSECERLGVAVGVHEGTHARVPTTGADRFDTRFAMHACSIPMEHMMAFLALVEGGVLERHPGLRVAFLEAGCGWVPYWLWRLDEEYEQLGWEVKKNVRLKPSVYFRRQCFVGCEPGEPYLPRVLDFIGEDTLLFGSDYPHIDHTPAALGDLLAANAGAGAGVMAKMLRDNPRRFYGI
jgi:predicted TIM-barrel fold metal-dependent hydrolase